jgi:hypothetical protein
MNSRVSWSAEGIDPSVRERAEAAARRAGMSLNDWLNSTIGASGPSDFRFRARMPRMSRTFISGWTPSPARSSRFRSRRRAAMHRETSPASPGN